MSRLPAWRFRAPFGDFAGKLTGSHAREEANDCIAMTLAAGHDAAVQMIDTSVVRAHQLKQIGLCDFVSAECSPIAD
jgi:hypothetical protein